MTLHKEYLEIALTKKRHRKKKDISSGRFSRPTRSLSNHHQMIDFERDASGKEPRPKGNRLTRAGGPKVVPGGTILGVPPSIPPKKI